MVLTIGVEVGVVLQVRPATPLLAVCCKNTLLVAVIALVEALVTLVAGVEVPMTICPIAPAPSCKVRLVRVVLAVPEADTVLSEPYWLAHNWFLKYSGL